MNQFGLIRNLTDVKVLSEWGILFLVGLNFRFIVLLVLIILFLHIFFVLVCWLYSLGWLTSGFHFW